MSSPTEIFLPGNLPYPITILSLDSPLSSTIQRGTRLLSYSFVHLSTEAGTEPETRYGTWDSSIEGELQSWSLKPSQVVVAKKAHERPALIVIEPCKHGIQIGGLCGLCGKDMTSFDYTGWSDASRASIQMTHDAFGPTVSMEEAQKLEQATANHLLKSRKLSLIVDLDQTVVHATVDPTVGEWFNEGHTWEQRRAKKAEESGAAKEEGDGSDSDQDVSMSEDEEECNPNWPALKNVRSFRLGPESFSGPSQRAGRVGNNTHRLENEGCMYYIKPRPGLDRFLEEMSQLYEMHIYTMGTRAYAEQVCAILDPEGKHFGNRLLSRDESGSLTQKSLQRLFPCDTSMVVIIDDRADVWEWSPNLIKVIPFDFFVGIGDINSTFLPKVAPIAPPPTAPANTRIEARAEEATQTPEEVEKAKLQASAMVVQNSIALEAQRDERPLAKKQEQLEDVTETEKESVSPPTPDVPTPPQTDAAAAAAAPAPAPQEPPAEKHVKKALLKDNDWELIRVSSLLTHIHEEFYTSYDARAHEKKGKPKSSSHRKHGVQHDVTNIIPRMRFDTFKGLHLVFSSVIPLDTKPETTEVWKMAHLFGATCSTELSTSVTHVVAAKKGTMKVDAARRRGGIKVVWLSWFTDSVALWKRQDESAYYLDEPKTLPVPGSTSSPTLDPTQVSSDPEPDDDEWLDSQPVAFDVPWDEINDEVDAAMMESDDESVKASKSGNVSDAEDMSDDGGSAQSSPSATPRKRKRPRSSTPSESMNGDSEMLLRSPLSKRKKLAAERTGASKLKLGITAVELGTESIDLNHPAPNQATLRATAANDADEEDDEGDSDDSESSAEAVEMDDDFLARELTEWS